MRKEKEVTYKNRELFAVKETEYSDGLVRYSMEGTDADGTKWSSGMFNDIDLLVEILFQIGKVKRTTVYVSK